MALGEPLVVDESMIGSLVLLCQIYGDHNVKLMVNVKLKLTLIKCSSSIPAILSSRSP